jgi:competence ComEA-like helix-hairpin-helix protein
MKSPLQDYFDFSRKEQMGLLMLVSIILACLIVLGFHDYLFPRKSIDISAKEQELIAAIDAERALQAAEYTNRDKGNSNRTSKKHLAEPFAFDPNTLDESGYVRLGFSEKQAKSIRSYFSKGGKVRKTSDFRKLYVVNDYMYERLSPYISLPEKVQSSPESTLASIKSEKKAEAIDPEQHADIAPPKPAVDINSATAKELEALRGIGPIYAERIIKYRDILGGYSSLDQLGEVYGLKEHPEIIADLKPQMIVGERQIKKININTCEWIDLVRNPYIEKEVANSILAIRKTHGNFTEVSDIKRSHLINDVLFDSISPYLTVDSR